MPNESVTEEVGDLFVTETDVTLKLLPSCKQGTRSISWFSKGEVTDVRLAAKDIAAIVGKLQGKKRVVRGLTVMTSQGRGVDLHKTGLSKAVEKAGFSVLS